MGNFPIILTGLIAFGSAENRALEKYHGVDVQKIPEVSVMVIAPWYRFIVIIH